MILALLVFGSTSVFVEKGNLKVCKVIYKTRSFIAVAPLNSLLGFDSYDTGVFHLFQLAQATEVIQEKSWLSFKKNQYRRKLHPFLIHGEFSTDFSLLFAPHLPCMFSLHAFL